MVCSEDCTRARILSLYRFQGFSAVHNDVSNVRRILSQRALSSHRKINKGIKTTFTGFHRFLVDFTGFQGTSESLKLLPGFFLVRLLGLSLRILDFLNRRDEASGQVCIHCFGV